MTDLMQTLYDYITRSKVPGYIDYGEYSIIDHQMEQLEKEVFTALGAEKQTAFQRYLDTRREQESIGLEAMFLAAFAAARELA